MKNWTCIQLGAREHYAIPRALQKRRRLDRLITDAWCPPSSALRIFARRVRGRWHAALEGARVDAPKVGRYFFELGARLQRCDEWKRIDARNEWFQRYALRKLTEGSSTAVRDCRPILFSYSYTAREPFRWAKAHGWRTVLGQIDPGPLEQTLVERDSASYASLASGAASPHETYWRNWRQEIELADLVMVNSEWSKSLLAGAGVPESKMRILPLAYEPRGISSAESYVRTSEAVSRSAGAEKLRPRRPLRVLFLGQINLRKGVGQIFDAIRLLDDQSINFRFVGPLGVSVPDAIRRRKNVEFLPPVPTHLIEEQYNWADVFLLPTLSDGFAITQLEAIAHGVPVIASRRCGDVVHHQENGLTIDSVTPDTISSAIRYCASNRDRVASFAAKCRVEGRFSMTALEENLDWLGRELETL